LTEDKTILSHLHAAVKPLPGGRYELTYTFDEANQLSDWLVMNPAGIWEVAGGELVQRSNVSGITPMGTQLVTKACFIGDVEIEVEFVPVDNDRCGFHICQSDAWQTYTFEMNADWGKTWQCTAPLGMNDRPRSATLWSFTRDYDPQKMYRLRFGRKGADLYGFVDGLLMFTVRDTRRTSGAVALGCKGQAGIRYASVVIRGRFDGRWIEDNPPYPPPKETRMSHDIELLTASLRSSVPAVRWASAAELAHVREDTVLVPLIGALHAEDNAYVRRQMMWSIAGHGADSVRAAFAAPAAAGGLAATEVAGELFAMANRIGRVPDEPVPALKANPRPKPDPAPAVKPASAPPVSPQPFDKVLRTVADTECPGVEWLVYESRFVARKDNKTIRNFEEFINMRQLAPIRVSALAFMKDSVWVATDKGAFCFERAFRGWVEYAINREHVGVPVKSVKALSSQRVEFILEVEGSIKTYVLDTKEFRWE